MSEAQLSTIDKKFVSILDANVSSKKKRENLVLNGVANEAIGWWAVAKGLYHTKKAIAANDSEYAVIKITKEGEQVNDPDGRAVIITQTFKAYCEDTFSEAGLSRSRREELVTAYGILEELRLAGFDVSELPKVTQHATLLAKQDVADRADLWSDFLDTGDITPLKPVKKIAEPVEGEGGEASDIEDAEVVEDKPLEYFAQQFIDRIADRTINSPEMMAVLASQIISELEQFAYSESAEMPEESNE